MAGKRAGAGAGARVVEWSSDGKKNKKREYSVGVRGAQTSTRQLNRAAESVSSVVAAGVEKWRRDWDASARKRRDGGLRDAATNATRAISTTLRRSSWAPVEVARAVQRSRLWRDVVRGLRF